MRIAPLRCSISDRSRRGLGLAVAALLVSNGVILFEQVSGRDLIQIVTGGESGQLAAVFIAGSGHPGTSSGVNRDNGSGAGDRETDAVAPGSEAEAESGPASSRQGDGGSSARGGGRPRAGSPSTTGPGGEAGSDLGAATSAGAVIGGGSGAGTAHDGSGGGGDIAVSNASSGSAPGAATPAPGGMLKPAGSDRMAGTLSDLAGFVRQARGLSYKNPVTTHIVDETAFRSKNEAIRVQPLVARASQAQGLFESLALLPGGTDFAAEVKRLSSGAFGAVYDDRTNELFVRNTDLTPYLRSTVVHELTRALDDQWFELHRPDLNRTFDDASIAFDSLVEGDATSVQARYIASLPEEQRNQVKAEQQRLAGERPKDVAPAVIATLTFRAGAGQLFVDNLVRRGGPRQLDAAFRTVPESTEQILHPDKYVAGERPRATDGPPADGSVTGKGHLGQLFLTLMLAGHMEPQSAARAAEGWGGDSYVTWTQGSRICSRLTVSTDSGVDPANLGGALAAWSTKTGGTVDGTGPFTVTRCR